MTPGPLTAHLTCVPWAAVSSSSHHALNVSGPRIVLDTFYKLSKYVHLGLASFLTLLIKMGKQGHRDSVMHPRPYF